MSNANPRSDRDAKRPSESGVERSASEPTQPGTGTAAAGSEPGVEEQLEQTIEQRYADLEERYDEIRDRLDDANRTAMEFIREHPGLSIGAALGFGYIVGRLASNRWLK